MRDLNTSSFPAIVNLSTFKVKRIPVYLISVHKENFENKIQVCIAN